MYKTIGKRNYLTNDLKIATVALQESAFFSKQITPDHPLVRICDHAVSRILKMARLESKTTERYSSAIPKLKPGTSL
jgi:hypothetical protein